jgi:uncharacterized protein YdaU (DUF1376 family)
MHYYRFSIGDYARSTRHLSNDEDLTYRRLLDMYYENENPIPLETQWVARRIRMDSEVVEIVLNDMFKRSDDGFRHARCDAEIAEYHKQAERNRINGKQGGRPKKAEKQEEENPAGFESEPNGNRMETLTNNQEPTLEPKGSCETGVSPVRPSEIIEAWNITAADLGLPRIVKLTADRKRKLAARCKDSTLEEFQQALESIRRSKFLQGGNKDGWKANFDFFLQPKSFAKLIEGAYD